MRRIIVCGLIMLGLVLASELIAAEKQILQIEGSTTVGPIADSAVEAQKAGDIDTERIIYNNMLANFVAASESLHSETGSIKYKMGWYKSARHNKPLIVAYYLFREHLTRFGILHLDVVVYTTWIAFWGGYFAHKKHNWKKLENVMIKYWRCIHKVCPIRPPLQI